MLTNESLPPQLASDLAAAEARWEGDGGTKRLFARDATLFTNKDEARWLGWLDLPWDDAATATRTDQARAIAAGSKHVVVLGMGGSSLCPDVLRATFGSAPRFPHLLVLDSTVPAQVLRIDATIDPAETLFVLASKSGSTLEPNCFFDFFYARVKAKLGDKAGQRFVAITDPGSNVEKLAKERGFRAVFSGIPSVGGRFSALSAFGMVPAAMIGMDVASLLFRAKGMAEQCRDLPPKENPGVRLGLVLGAAAKRGRDKMTIVASPRISLFGAWIEQLVAESLGKEGKAVIPIDGERPAPAASYGQDRVFVHLRVDADQNAEHDAALDVLAKAGHPVITLRLHDTLDLGAEMFRFEIATAVAGAMLGVHPFDQPDVEASKIETRKLTDRFEAEGQLPQEKPFFESDGVSLFSDAANQKALGAQTTLDEHLRAFLAQHHAGDYFALLAYIDMSPPHEALLQEMRHRVRAQTRLATCVGFGPRFLHSTGQAYKGGPATGLFLQITCDDPTDVAIEGRKASFGVVKSAQARGDFEVLVSRKRRALRIHLAAKTEADVAVMLGKLRDALSAATS